MDLVKWHDSSSFAAQLAAQRAPETRRELVETPRRAKRVPRIVAERGGRVGREDLRKLQRRRSTTRASVIENPYSGRFVPHGGNYFIYAQIQVAPRFQMVQRKYTRDEIYFLGNHVPEGSHVTLEQSNSSAHPGSYDNFSADFYHIVGELYPGNREIGATPRQVEQELCGAGAEVYDMSATGSQSVHRPRVELVNGQEPGLAGIVEAGDAFGTVHFRRRFRRPDEIRGHERFAKRQPEDRPYVRHRGTTPTHLLGCKG
jgi:hypothetical protein